MSTLTIGPAAGSITTRASRTRSAMWLEASRIARARPGAIIYLIETDSRTFVDGVTPARGLQGTIDLEIVPQIVADLGAGSLSLVSDDHASLDSLFKHGFRASAATAERAQ